MDHLTTTRAALLFAFGTLCLRPDAADAQTSAAGARDAALTGASAASSGPASDRVDLWSGSNPAGWSNLRGFAAAIHVAELYGLDELRLGAVQAGFNVRKAAIVTGVRTFGYKSYRETVFTSGLARAFHWGTYRPFHAGIRIRYHRTTIPAYGSASAYALSTGLVLPVAPGTDVGLAAENMMVLAGGLAQELPRRLHAGVSISAGTVLLLAGASKEVRTPLAARFGIEVHLVDVLALRAGYSLEPPRFASGIGLHLDSLTIDVAAERHFVLGWTPSCSVGLLW